jgi:hypothetical protein
MYILPARIGISRDADSVLFFSLLHTNNTALSCRIRRARRSPNSYRGVPGVIVSTTHSAILTNDSWDYHPSSHLASLPLPFHLPSGGQAKRGSGLPRSQATRGRISRTRGSPLRGPVSVYPCSLLLGTRSRPFASLASLTSLHSTFPSSHHLSFGRCCPVVTRTCSSSQNPRPTSFVTTIRLPSAIRTTKI